MTEKAKGKKGFQAGNTFGKGRPVGSTNRASFVSDYASEDDHACIVKNLIEMAKERDFSSMMLYINKTCQTPKLPSKVELDLKPMQTLKDVDDAMRDVVFEAVTGSIHLDDAKELIEMINSRGQALQKVNQEGLDEVRALVNGLDFTGIKPGTLRI